ncbi:unnamed protein product [Moneuplotes crassus]|uniref:Methyltransferase type 11 domain-containing protein n=1 Tax=Euplotes crassus TaxID=5936 RepID=A0AAD1XKF8_EUPCR|nr:unnamed protein product [Moneuplotes crassus]
MEIIYPANLSLNEFSQTYDQEIANITRQSALTLYNLVDFPNSTKVIDVGRGTGLSSDCVIGNSKKGTRFLSKNLGNSTKIMVPSKSYKITHSSMDGSISSQVVDPTFCNCQLSPNLEVPTRISQEIMSFSSEVKSEQDEKVFRVINEIEQLPFDNGSFDAYTCNLTFQFNSNYLRALCESYRVLSKGGKAAFSIWGREENCTFLTFLPNILESRGIQIAPEFDIDFDLISTDQIIEDAKDIGFRSVKKIHVPFYYFIMDAEEMWEFLVNSSHRKQLDELDEDTLNCVKEDVYREFESNFGDQTDEMIGFEVTFILCTK